MMTVESAVVSFCCVHVFIVLNHLSMACITMSTTSCCLDVFTLVELTYGVDLYDGEPQLAEWEGLQKSTVLKLHRSVMIVSFQLSHLHL